MLLNTAFFGAFGFAEIQTEMDFAEECKKGRITKE